MANIPANIGPTLDAAFGQALTTAGGWTNAGGNVGFSLSSLLNSIQGSSGSGTFTNLTVTGNLITLGSSGANSQINFSNGLGTFIFNTSFGFIIADPVQAGALYSTAFVQAGTYLQTGTFAQIGTHLIPASSTVPTVGSFNAGFGTVTGSAITGGDAAGIISFTTGTASAITANQALCTVTLATTYSSTAYAVMVANATASGALDASDYYAVPATANTFIIYNTSAITPSSTTLYKLQFMTMGAGATS